MFHSLIKEIWASTPGLQNLLLSGVDGIVVSRYHENETDDFLAAEAANLPADCPPDMPALKALNWARASFCESLRLYPPLPMLVRTALSGDVFNRSRVSRGDLAVVSLWHLHRHRKYWDAPDDFVPARWLGDGPRCPQAFMPFSAGARRCPSAALAIAEGVFFLSRICALFELSRIDGKEAVPAARLTTRSANGIRLQIRRRTPKT